LAKLDGFGAPRDGYFSAYPSADAESCNAAVTAENCQKVAIFRISCHGNPPIISGSQNDQHLSTLKLSGLRAQSSNHHHKRSRVAGLQFWRGFAIF